MRISDWSSDVCSSDLVGQDQVEAAPAFDQRLGLERVGAGDRMVPQFAHRIDRRGEDARVVLDDQDVERVEIGRASCRERVGQYVEISVVAGRFKTKKQKQKSNVRYAIHKVLEC